MICARGAEFSLCSSRKEEEGFVTSAGRRFRKSESGRKNRPASFGMTPVAGVGNSKLEIRNWKHEEGHDVSCPTKDNSTATKDRSTAKNGCATKARAAGEGGARPAPTKANAKANAKAKAKAKAKEGDGAAVLTGSGQVRPYKRLEHRLKPVPLRRRLVRASHVSPCYSGVSAFGGSPFPPALEVVMNKALRIVLIVVVVLVVFLLVAPFLIPVNEFRPTIEEKASAALGRKVQLGNISLSLISGSLAAENLSIGDDPKFSSAPFLTAKSLNVGVEILPLIFSKTLNVTGVTIASPQVTLLRNAAGQWNYSSLGGSAAKSQAKQAPAEKSSGTSNAEEVSVKKLTLSDGSIIVGSTNSQRRSTYDHVNVTASNVSLTSKRS